MLHFSRIHQYLSLDQDECRELGRSLADRYQTASPFPHIVIDDFIDPAVLKTVLTEFPSGEEKEFFDRDQERFKFQFQPLEVSSGVTRNLFSELNGQAFLGFLEELTGIEALVSDPYFIGGGLHETKRGGHLGVHADFNVHGIIKLERKINLLIYLNEDWDPSFGGQLELWDRQMKECVERVEPVFWTRSNLQHRTGQLPRSPRPAELPAGSLTTINRHLLLCCLREWLWLRRPSVQRTSVRARHREDKADWKIRRQHFVNDWVPPKLQRIAHRLIG